MAVAQARGATGWRLRQPGATCTPLPVPISIILSTMELTEWAIVGMVGSLTEGLNDYQAAMPEDDAGDHLFK
ncbi:hypothetical protein Q7C36_017305 [Tachysurus vachellii]|uniref:Uncharacterized protein n=1 Tax=Tachysurus vachellii TaxID=175792 RepID=A0AA88SCX3_TACVA|nr:hypothetical protein Q7C36_017305 [Tachysurus vachellii]